MRGEEKPSDEAKTQRYAHRAIKRTIKTLLLLFALLVVIVGIIWAVPKLISLIS